MIWFTDHYLGPVSERGDLGKDPRVSPLYTSDLSGVAPATVITADFDPLRDEGHEYAAALAAAGVAVTEQRYPTMIHGFISMAAITTVTNEALDEAAAALRARAGLSREMGRLDNTVSLITGGASGIGAACAERFRAEGATVVTADIAGEPDRLLDVTDEAAVASAVDAIVAEHGRLDSVVNAAGVAGGGPVHLMPMEEWARVIAVNLTGTFIVAKHGPAADGGAGLAAASSTSPASRGSRAPRAAAPTTPRRAASCCSPRTWPSTTAAPACGPTPSAPGSSRRR